MHGTDNALQRVFQDLASDLDRFRAMDKALDAACQDFEELAQLQAAALTRGDHSLSGTAQVSLEEVTLEIERRLRGLQRGHPRQT